MDWFPLAGVVLGALLAFLFSRIGATLEGQREHRKWLRERRYEAYHSYLATCDKWSVRMSAGDPDDDPAFFDEMTAVEAAVELVSPSSVVAAMEPMRESLISWKHLTGPAHLKHGTEYWKLQREFTYAAQKLLLDRRSKRP